MNAEERQLSDRERTVLLLAAEGLTDKEIAKHLNLSQRTIGTYWERMRQKLGPYSRTQLVARFLRVEVESERISESYRTLFSTWDEGVWILSPTGKTIYANKSTATLLGVKLDSVLQSDAVELFREVASVDLRKFLDGITAESEWLEFEVKCGDGTPVWLNLRGFPVADRRAKILAVVLLFKDVSLQKRVQHTVETCNSALEFIAKHATDYVIRFNADGVCVSANRSCAEALGRTPADMGGKTLAQLKELQPQETWANALQDCITGGKLDSFESEWGQVKLRTYLLPEPSLGLMPNVVLCVTPVKPPR